jgi:peptidoglycan/LPS O-acetylase OafA/YrhL
MLENRNRIKTLDAFRGIAVLSVVLYHYCTRFNDLDRFPGLYNNVPFFMKGYLGVHLFFLISGFVIFLTIEQVKSAREFILKRFLRLFPTYWLCILISATSIYLFIGKLPDSFQISIKDIVGNFTMIQDLLRPIYPFKHIDGAYWSLLPELLFYGMIAVLFRFRLLKYIKIIGTVWLVISAVCTYFDLNISMAGIILNFRYGSLFFGGIMFYILWKDGKERKLWYNHAIIALSFIVSCFLIMFFTYKIADCVISVFLYIVFYLFIYGKLNFINFKFLLFLGKISYPWYLLHQTIGFLILYWLHRQFNFTSCFTIVIPLLFTGALAYLVNKYYEDILIKKLKKRALKLL